MLKVADFPGDKAYRIKLKFYLEALPMGFWWGVMIEIFAGVNIGIVAHGLLAGAKRQENSQGYLWDRPQMDQAVMDEGRVRVPAATRPSPNGSTYPGAPF